ncbi:hypothetical protein MesoLj131c_69110 (plasmid) [Mesorhizobium sp. 131-3-5]|nr:hypothetical protein MesoLj131c_69110 [Mesorhizobium sp. 131-3-5]
MPLAGVSGNATHRAIWGSPSGAPKAIALPVTKRLGKLGLAAALVMARRSQLFQRRPLAGD